MSDPISSRGESDSHPVVWQRQPLERHLEPGLADRLIREEIVLERRRRRAAYAILVGLVIVLGVCVWQWVTPPPLQPATKKDGSGSAPSSAMLDNDGVRDAVIRALRSRPARGGSPGAAASPTPEALPAPAGAPR